MSDLISSGERFVTPSIHVLPQHFDDKDEIDYTKFNPINHESNDPSPDFGAEISPAIMQLTRNGSLFASYVTDSSSTMSASRSFFTTECINNNEISSFTSSLKQIGPSSMVTITSTPTDEYNDLSKSPAIVSRNSSLKLWTDNSHPIVYHGAQSYRCANDDDDDEDISSRRSSIFKVDSEDDEDIDRHSEISISRANLNTPATITSRWNEKGPHGTLPTPTRSSLLPQNPVRQRRGAIGYSSLMMASAVLARLELGDDIDDDSRPQSRPAVVYQSDLSYPEPSLPQRTRGSPMLKRRFDTATVAMSMTSYEGMAMFLPPSTVKEISDSSTSAEPQRSSANKSISFSCGSQESLPMSLSVAERTSAKQTRASTPHSPIDENNHSGSSSDNVSDLLKSESSSSVSPANAFYENQDNETVLCPPKRRRADS